MAWGCNENESLLREYRIDFLAMSYYNTNAETAGGRNGTCKSCIDRDGEQAGMVGYDI